MQVNILQRKCGHYLLPNQVVKPNIASELRKMVKLQCVTPWSVPSTLFFDWQFFWNFKTIQPLLVLWKKKIKFHPWLVMSTTEMLTIDLLAILLCNSGQAFGQTLNHRHISKILRAILVEILVDFWVNHSTTNIFANFLDNIGWVLCQPLNHRPFHIILQRYWLRFCFTSGSTTQPKTLTGSAEVMC